MTRPMPGPPGGFTDYARLNYALLGKQITYEQYQEFGAALRMAFTARPKRLTDAECAAEYWRAEAHFLLDLHGYEYERDPVPADHNFVKWLETCVRFDTCPHALEES